MELTSIQIQEKIKNGEDFILDCHALWCGPCKAMAPHFDRAAEIIKEDMPNVSLYKYNIDSDRTFTGALGIRSVPTIKVFKSGKEVHSQPGMLVTEQLVSLSRSKFLL